MNIVLGGPGCGKTTYLLGEVEKELTAGVKPEEIAYVAFTRKAAHEAQERAGDKFGLSKDDLPYFRTLHSLAFRQLRLSNNQVMGPEDYKTIGSALGVELVPPDEETGLSSPDNKGTQLAYLEQISRLTMQPLQEVCAYYKTQNYWNAKLYADTLRSYKDVRKLMDFTDMIKEFVARDEMPPVKVVFVDEAQDLSPLQWQMVRLLTAGAERVYVAGDDDQAIYEWSGADVQTFLSLQGNIHVLPLSHRLPRKVFDRAHDILHRIKHRYEKIWHPASEGGIVEHYSALEQVDLSSGTWFVLARNRYMLPAFMEALKAKGYPFLFVGRSSTANENVLSLMHYENLRRGERLGANDVKVLYSRLRAGAYDPKHKSLARLEATKSYGFDDLRKDAGLKLEKSEDWMTALRIGDKEREYYRAILRRGESLIRHPRITVSTIHQVKGGEAEQVLVCPDMAYQCYRSLGSNPDSEARVFYVAVTRAKKGLHILYPRTGMHYAI